MRLFAISTAFLGMAFASPALSQSDFVTACESILQDRLVAPSTYKRVQETVVVKELTINEYGSRYLVLGEPSLVEFVNAVGRKELKPYLHLASVEYDVSNEYGVPVRHSFSCELVTGSESLGDFNADWIMIDAWTRRSWKAEAKARY